MCKAAKAWAHGRTAPSELLPGGSRWKHSGHVECQAILCRRRNEEFGQFARHLSRQYDLSLHPVPNLLDPVTYGSLDAERCMQLLN